jgi:hypothetical protein
MLDLQIPSLDIRRLSDEEANPSLLLHNLGLFSKDKEPLHTDKNATGGEQCLPEKKKMADAGTVDKYA